MYIYIYFSMMCQASPLNHTLVYKYSEHLPSQLQLSYLIDTLLVTTSLVALSCLL